jgi:hypothetical protein
MLQKQHKYHVSTLKPLPLSGFLYRKAGLICYRRGSAIFFTQTSLKLTGWLRMLAPMLINVSAFI